MNNNGGGNSRRRRWLAALLAPFAASPFTTIGASDSVSSSSVSAHSALGAYVLQTLIPIYLSAAPAAAVVWLLLSRLKAPPRFWLVVPLFTAILSALLWIYGNSKVTPVSGLWLGLIVSGAYCLIAWLWGASGRAGPSSVVLAAPDAAPQARRDERTA